MHTTLFKKYAKPIDYKLIHRVIYRYLSLPFIWIFIKLKIHPNLITITGTTLRVIGLYLYIISSIIPAIAFYLFGYLLDWCDGPVSRVTGKTSEFGAKLEKLTDAIIDYLFYLALPIGLFLHYHEPGILIIGFVFFNLMAIRRYISLVINANAEGRERFYFYRAKISHDDKYYKNKESLKAKYSIFSRLFCMVINFTRMVFPLIILFDLNIIMIFYLINIFIETIRIIFDAYITIKVD